MTTSKAPRARKPKTQTVPAVPGPAGVRVDRKAFTDAVTFAARVATARPGALPALNGLRVTTGDGQLTVTGTDLDVTVQVGVPTDGPDRFDVLIPARILTGVVAKCPGDIVLQADDDEMLVTSGDFDARLVTSPGADHPTVRLPGPGVNGSVDGIELRRTIGRVLPAAATDEARPILCGVLVANEDGYCRMTATDSYRLAVADSTVPQLGGDLLIPGRLLRLVGFTTADRVTVSVESGIAGFTAGNVTVSGRLIEGEFPNYRALLPDSVDVTVMFDRERMIDAVERVAAVIGKDDPVRVDIQAGQVTVSAVTVEVGKAGHPVTAKVTGEPLTIAFNARYLLAALRSYPTETVTLNMRDAFKPVVFTAAGFQHLLMPVRVPGL